LGGRTKQHLYIAHVLDLKVVISILGPKIQLWGFGLFSSDCVNTAMSTISHWTESRAHWVDSEDNETIPGARSGQLAIAQRQRQGSLTGRGTLFPLMSFQPYEPSEHPGIGNTSQRSAPSGQQWPDRDRKDRPRLAIHLVTFPRGHPG